MFSYPPALAVLRASLSDRHAHTNTAATAPAAQPGRADRDNALPQSSHMPAARPGTVADRCDWRPSGMGTRRFRVIVVWPGHGGGYSKPSRRNRVATQTSRPGDSERCRDTRKVPPPGQDGTESLACGTHTTPTKMLNCRAGRPTHSIIAGKVPLSGSTVGACTGT